MTRQSLWRQRLVRVLVFQAPVFIAMSLALLVPLTVAFFDADSLPTWHETRSYLIPAALALLLGLVIRYRRPSIQSLSPNDALLITTAAWLVTGLLGAIPFILLLNLSFTDAVLESVSGFTTAGTTMLTGLDSLPRSILVWRSLTQWLGGLGILLIVLLVGRTQGNQGLLLLSAEGVKVSSGRLSLNFQRAVYRFTVIYLVLTLGQTIITSILGMSLFDSILHAMTTVSTGGFSPHDESLTFYRNRPDQFPYFMLIETIVIIFMMAGGINFFVLYRLGRGKIAALWDGLEMKLVWLVVGLATIVVTLNATYFFHGRLTDWLLRSTFLVASLVSTTGYETTATGSFPRLSKEIFLMLMVLGGGAGSTAGGIKIIRLAILGKFLSYEIRQLRLPPHAIQMPRIDGRAVSNKAFRQAVFILLLWILYLAFAGSIVSLLAPELKVIDAYSTVFSAIGVYGPSFVSVDTVIAFPDLAKWLLTLGMLAGRLEILPLLVFFNLNAWRR
ncbi:MAG: TrkH family potassium uptake protein [Chloroflexi bacterium]|nr:TrkH family potassium uptake protein [Chloroflexota bacterium]